MSSFSLFVRFFDVIPAPESGCPGVADSPTPSCVPMADETGKKEKNERRERDAQTEKTRKYE